MAKVTKKPQKSNINELLDSTKLSRRASVIPALGEAPQKSEDGCGVCEAKLEGNSDFPSEVKVCRKCLIQYAVTASVLDDHADGKTRQLQLRRLQGGAR